MKEVYFIGLDIAKNVFQLFLADEHGKEIANKRMSRSKMVAFLAKQKPCVIGIEACGTAHHWGRVLTGMGHQVKLIQPIRVKAFLGHRNKTDAADAKAICEALMHPGTNFVHCKTIEQQDMDHLLARRERLVANRTQIVNQTRSFLAERGIVLPQGRQHFEKVIPLICREHWEEFSGDFHQQKIYYSHGFIGYQNVVYPGKYIRNSRDKCDTYTVEGVNADLRHYIPMLKRSSRCFARSLETLVASMNVFTSAYNPFGIAKAKYRERHPNVKDIPLAVIDYL